GDVDEMVGRDYNNLGVLASDVRHFEEAEMSLNRALEIRSKTLGENHPDYAATLVNLARVYRVSRRTGEALNVYQRALPILEHRLGADDSLVAEVRTEMRRLQDRHVVDVNSFR